MQTDFLFESVLFLFLIHTVIEKRKKKKKDVHLTWSILVCLLKLMEKLVSVWCKAAPLLERKPNNCLWIMNIS